VDQLHEVHDQRNVRRVLALDVREQLAGLNAELLHDLFPGHELGRHPVAVGAQHDGPAQVTHVFHDLRNLRGLRVFCVDEHGQARP
jgi:hypothetical protein